MKCVTGGDLELLYVYGLAIAGEAGIREVIRNIVAEFDLTLALAGSTKASELNGDCLAK
jgi:lactate 2-monooxygenase